MFWVFEKDTNENFANIPSALYMVAIFLGGEWAVADFTVPGKVLCCAYIVIGIGLFAIPIGTVFESFQDVLASKQEEMVEQVRFYWTENIGYPLSHDKRTSRVRGRLTGPRPFGCLWNIPVLCSFRKVE